MKFLSFVRFAPYYLGKSLTRKELLKALQDLDFDVEDVQALSYHPRLVMLAYARIVRKLFPRSADQHLDRILRWFDNLKTSPWRFITGAFIAVNAKRVR